MPGVMEGARGCTRSMHRVLSGQTPASEKMGSRKWGLKKWGQSRFSLRQPLSCFSLVRRRRAMARPGRYFLPDQPLHVIQRGNNRQPVFFAAEDRTRYREWLAEAAA